MRFSCSLVYIYKEMVAVFTIFGKAFVGGKAEPHGKEVEEPLYIADLYNRYRAFLFQKAGLYTDNLYAKEDIVQNTVLRLIRNENKLCALDPPALTTYITLTVRSAALNFLRAEDRNRMNALPLEEDDEEDYIPLDGSVPLTLEEQMLLGHRNDEVRAAIGRLSERDQAALLGKYFLEMDSRELSELLDVAPGTLRTLLCRARARVLEELKKEDILHE